MIGVKFTRAMRPYGAGDTALVTDSLGIALIRNGDADRYYFPENPHAVEAGSTSAPACMRKEDIAPVPRYRQKYRVKGRV